MCTLRYQDHSFQNENKRTQKHTSTQKDTPIYYVITHKDSQIYTWYHRESNQSHKKSNRSIFSIVGLSEAVEPKDTH